jgi:hypothetical protein
MSFVQCFIKVVVAWFLLVIIGKNLLGMVVRGSFLFPPISDAAHSDIVAREAQRLRISGDVITVIFLLLTVAYFIVLYRVWNSGVTLAAVLLMAQRFPSLIYEIRVGRKLTKEETRSGKYPYSRTSIVMSLLALPLLWYSL